MRYIYFLYIFLTLHSFASGSYHFTEYLFQKIVTQCSLHPNLTCQWHDDILIVDWKRNQPMDQLWVFNEHARERITAEIAYHTLLDIVSLQPDKRITMIPVLNVWGRKQVEKGNGCLRKNQFGVDTNRNYQTLHTHKYSRDSEEYEGKRPLSEKESQLVSSLLLKGVQRYINVHSGEYSMYMPFDSSTSVPPNAKRMRYVLQKLKPMCPQCVYGSAAVASTYKAYGTSVDYAIHNGVPEAYTFEVFGDVSTSCVTMFNPSTKNYETVVNMWARILMATVIDDDL